MENKFEKDNELIKEYLNNKSMNSISKMTNLSKIYIKNILMTNNIKIRSLKEQLSLNRISLSKEFLEEEYVQKRKSIYKIKKDTGIGKSTIFRMLKGFGIPLRDKHESCKKILNKEELFNLYFTNFLPMSQIAIIKNVKESTINNNLKYYGVNTSQRFIALNRKYSNKIKTLNNEGVVSFGEKIIADWLFDNEIDYVYEKRLKNTRFKCDFYIPSINMYIEYFGLKGFKPYKEKMQQKLNFYKENNLNLLAIYPKDNIIQVLENNLLIKVNQQNHKYKETELS